MAGDAGKAGQADGRLGRQLRLSPISRSSSDPKTLARHNGGSPSYYELMALERIDDSQ